MLEIFVYLIFMAVGFVLGALVANNNVKKTEKIVNELKDKLEDLNKKD